MKYFSISSPTVWCSHHDWTIQLPHTLLYAIYSSQNYVHFLLLIIPQRQRLQREGDKCVQVLLISGAVRSAATSGKQLWSPKHQLM